MTIKEIIDGLKFTVGMFLFDSCTGETYKEPRNDMDKTTIDACKGAIELLERTRWIPVSERLPNLDDYTGSRVWQKKVLITGYLSFDDTKEPFVSEAFAKDVIRNRVHDTVVIAWMPLPQPYKAESEG